MNKVLFDIARGQVLLESGFKEVSATKSQGSIMCTPYMQKPPQYIYSHVVLFIVLTRILLEQS